MLKMLYRRIQQSCLSSSRLRTPFVRLSESVSRKPLCGSRRGRLIEVAFCLLLSRHTDSDGSASGNHLSACAGVRLSCFYIIVSNCHTSWHDSVTPRRLSQSQHGM